MDGLERGTPGSVGASGRGIGMFLDSVARHGLELHGFMAWKAGVVVAEACWSPYRAELPHMQHSLTKSFTAAGVGLAVAENRLRLDDPVVSFFPDEVPAQPGTHLASMTVRDLLTMRTGHRTGISGSAWRPLRTSWVRAFFAEPVPERPGTRFVYSSASSYMLSAIVQKVTGQAMHDYLSQRLLRPLGCAPMAWDLCPNGINPGGNGLSCLTSDLVRFAALHLRRGLWAGQQLLPAAWVDAATSAVVPVALLDDPAPLRLPGAAGSPGYGFHWWTGPDGAYYAAGLFGQYAVVLPEADAVVAITAAVPQRDGRLLDLVWRDLRPALGTPGPGTVLRDRALPLPPCAPVPAQAAAVSGTVFDLAPNEDGARSVSFTFAEGTCTFRLEDASGTHTIRAGLDQLVEETTTMTGAELHHHYQPDTMRVAACGRWTGADTFAMTWVFNETAFRDTVVTRFEGDAVSLERSTNINTGPLHRPVLRGRARAA